MSPKTLFLTGANSGIGLATTRLFLSNGWNVFATARSPAAATELQALLQDKDYAPRLAIHRLDLNDPATFTPAVEAAAARFGVIDVLLNNAGVGQAGLFEQLGMGEWRGQFQVNVFGPIELTKTVLAHFHATEDATRPRSIIFTSSGAALFAMPLLGAYSGSKAALDLLVEAMHYELGAATASAAGPVAVKIVVPYGGVSETNFMSSEQARSLTVQLMGGGDGGASAPAELKERYGGVVGKTFELFGRWGGKGMPASAPAETVWTAATDGKVERLRYFVGPQDGGPAVRKRMRLSESERPDEVDDEYVQYMRGLYGN